MIDEKTFLIVGGPYACATRSYMVQETMFVENADKIFHLYIMKIPSVLFNANG
jgi:hypothetical protein